MSPFACGNVITAVFSLAERVKLFKEDILKHCGEKSDYMKICKYEVFIGEEGLHPLLMLI